ncbi:benzoate/H(+) symporter BenE family transporter [Deinococcus radiomollis]|uniref:benzoate/H(+) symporter BenE family transporter n=1 Tax=Deinococcus radiomollis TaxID=468916 RepID=UPI0038917039
MSVLSADLPESMPELPPPTLRDFRRDFSFSAALAGLVAVVVSYSGNIGLFVSVFAAGHYSHAQAVSAITAMYLGMAVIGAALSWRYRAPVIIGWISAGLAVLIQDSGRFTVPETVGALLASAFVLMVLGYTGLYERLTRRIPVPLTAALLGGVLLPFVLRGVAATASLPVVVVPMLLTYAVLRALTPRYAVPAVLLVGITASALSGNLHPLPAGSQVWGSLHAVVPAFSALSWLSLSLPITILALASQHLPGVAILRLSGYHNVPASPIVGGTGLLALPLAVFGSIGIALAAITAAICTGPEAHPDVRRRYVAGVMCAVWYALLGLFGGAVIVSAGALPLAMIQALAGLALLGTVQGAVVAAFAEVRWRESAALTLVVTASGLSLWGLSSPLWGLLIGGLSAALLRRGKA